MVSEIGKWQQTLEKCLDCRKKNLRLSQSITSGFDVVTKVEKT